MSSNTATILKVEPRVYHYNLRNTQIVDEISEFIKRSGMIERIEFRTEIVVMKINSTTIYVLHFKELKDTFFFDLMFANEIKQVYDNYG